jgi:hypothetical protein
MPRWAARVDGTHKEVMRAFRELGADVADTSRLGNFVDLVVAWRGMVLLVEVKTRRGRMRMQQLELGQRFPIHVVRSADEARALLLHARFQPIATGTGETG